MCDSSHNNNKQQTTGTLESISILFDPSTHSLSVDADEVELVPRPRAEAVNQGHSSPHGHPFEQTDATEVNNNHGAVGERTARIHPSVSQPTEASSNVNDPPPAGGVTANSSDAVGDSIPPTFQDVPLPNLQESNTLMEALRASDARFLASFTHGDESVQAVIDGINRDMSTYTLRLLHAGTPPAARNDLDWGFNFTPEDIKYYFNILRTASELLSDLYNALTDSLQNDNYAVRQNIYEITNQVRLVMSRLDIPRPDPPMAQLHAQQLPGTHNNQAPNERYVGRQRAFQDAQLGGQGHFSQHHQTGPSSASPQGPNRPTIAQLAPELINQFKRQIQYILTDISIASLDLPSAVTYGRRSGLDQFVLNSLWSVRAAYEKLGVCIRAREHP